LIAIILGLILRKLNHRALPHLHTGSRGKLNIALIGPGAIGTTFAFQLRKAGHDLTVVARGKRLAQLRGSENTIHNSKDGKGVTMTTVSDALDLSIEYDLLMINVLEHQLEPLVPVIKKSKARKVMFMFNTFHKLQTFIDIAGGKERFAIGFPAILGIVNDKGEMDTEIITSGPLLTTVSEKRWVDVFSAAGIPAMFEADMESWLRTHAALVYPVMLVSAWSYEHKMGVEWGYAMKLARATREALSLVKTLGNPITPRSMKVVDCFPIPVLATLLWVMSRLSSVRRVGKAGYGEARALMESIQETVKEEGLPEQMMATFTSVYKQHFHE